MSKLIERSCINIEKLTLTVEEVAKMIGVSKMTIYRMVQLNEVPSIRVRNKILFYRPTVEKWLTNGGTLDENN